MGGSLASKAAAFGACAGLLYGLSASPPHHRQGVAPSAIAPGTGMFTATGMQEIPAPRALTPAMARWHGEVDRSPLGVRPGLVEFRPALP